jgi:hypothetical protein
VGYAVMAYVSAAAALIPFVVAASWYRKRTLAAPVATS